jgi:hydroxymethylpyrimidine/phosphomethylpyrimidine kinase
MKRSCYALTIGGSDPTCGAGIHSDIQTFRDFQVYPFSVSTAITVQNSFGVHKVFPLASTIVALQLENLLNDYPIDVIKIGMVYNNENVATIVHYLKQYPNIPVVLDPVLFSKNNTHLWIEKDLASITKKLFPITYLLTPNLPEAELLSGINIHIKKNAFAALYKLQDMGASNILLKGGHALDHTSTDYLLHGESIHSFRSPRLKIPPVHGTGCMLSSAIAACIAQGKTLEKATQLSKKYLFNKMKRSFAIGNGNLRLMHHF